jgi:hypothetical protein
MIPRALMPWGIILLLAAGAVSGLVAYGYSRGVASRDAEVRSIGLSRDSAAAAGDTTRILLEDSIQRVVELRAMQVADIELQRERAIRDLQFERKVTSALLLVIREIRDSAEAVVHEDTADVRSAKFVAETETPPATITAEVELPRPPLLGRAHFAVQLGPIAMTLDDVCGPIPAGGGVRSAAVQVTAPAWADIEVTAAAQVADLCNPAPYRLGTFEHIRIGAPYAGAGILLGALGALIFAR